MNDKKLLIVGIDPGTTTGYAVLDIEGRLIHLDSSKQLNLSLLISKTIRFGKAILVGTDKAKAPHLVEEFATKLGSKVITPQEDIKVNEKRRLIESFEVGDEHQGDALASALFAYKEAKALLDKVEIFARENKKENIKDRIKELVITKKISIKAALSLIEKKDEEDKIVEKVITEKRLSESDFLKLYNKLKKHEAEIMLLNRYKDNLKNKIADLEKAQLKYEIKADGKRVADFRERRIMALENSLMVKEHEIDNLKSLVKKFDYMVSHINNFYVLKKLKTLGAKEFNIKSKVIDIQKNDILLIDNPNIASDSVISFLKDKVFVIVHKKPISEYIGKNAPFVFINAKTLKIREDRYFGFIEKKYFEMEKNKINWAKKIIEDYKEEKRQLILR